jgi:hypothetical protein
MVSLFAKIARIKKQKGKPCSGHLRKRATTCINLTTQFINASESRGEPFDTEKEEEIKSL